MNAVKHPSANAAEQLNKHQRSRCLNIRNAGRARRGELVSCFLLEVDDSLNSINFIDSTAKQLSKIGGGVAINLSKLRARGEAIKGIKGVAKGVLHLLLRHLKVDLVMQIN